MTSLYNGGAEKSLVNLLNELDPSKYDVDLLLLKKKGIFLNQVPEWVNILEIPLGVQLMYTPSTVKGHNYTKLFRLFVNAFVKGFIRRDCYARAFRWKYYYTKKISPINKKYDVAVAYITGELLYFLCEKTNADRKILWVHNDYRAEGQPEEFDRPYMSKIDAIVSISEKCVKVLKEVFPEFSNKIFEIHNITSSSMVQKQSEQFYPDEYSRDDINLVSVGRLAKQKGFDMAIEAVKILKDRNVKFKWFVLGTGGLNDKLNDMVSDYGVGDYIRFIGARENPYPYIKNATILVQPSRYEGKSVVLDEAKILGKPIVVTDYPTVRDQIIDKKEGIIVPMSPEGIADGIELILKDNELMMHVSDYLIRHEYGNQDEIKKYEEVLIGRE